MCKTEMISDKAEYYYTKFDSYANDTQVRDTVKLEPKLKNISGNHSCQVQLIIFTNTQRTASKPGGTTEPGKVDYNTNTMSFQKFFIMEYFFEKDQPIEFRITGTIDAVIKTSLPNIMGSRAQTFSRKIDGTDGIIFEIKGFSYRKKLTSTLNINIAIEGSLYGKGLVYSITAKGTNNNPQNQTLYRSELNVPLKNTRRIDFKLCSIPDIYISPDGNYQTSFVNVQIMDAKHNKKLGEYNGALAPLINTNTPLRLLSNLNATINMNANKFNSRDRFHRVKWPPKYAQQSPLYRS